MAENGTPVWLRTDERADVLSSLSACLLCLRHCNEDTGLWKWAILSLHSAIQGAMVCHLSGSAQLGALSEKAAAKWLDWHERDRKGETRRIDCGTNEVGVRQFRFADGNRPPPERLADAGELFERLINESKRIEGGAGAIIEVTAPERESFQRLHDLRNNFSHFTPKGWSVEFSGLPDAFLDMLRLVERIAADPWPFRHMSEGETTKLADLLKELREEVEARS